MSKKRNPMKPSKAIQSLMKDVEAEAKMVMNRVGLTDEDMARIPKGASFEEFSAHLDKIMAEKQKRGKS